jgi:formate--tetrahydrofolate ligase
MNDLSIARSVQAARIEEIAQNLGLSASSLEHYGPYKAKFSFELLSQLKSQPSKGKLILVTAINPTAAGEGKTTTTVGLGDGLGQLGKKVVIALREPSLGPCFGMKGGAAGGGYAQVVPMEDINLHFTGDFHAITAANNLLAALVDNHLQQGNALGLDPRRIYWKRCLDMNDRALRQIVIGLGGTSQGIPREDGFEITVASEIMAILCLSKDLSDLKQRLGQIIVGETHDKRWLRAADFGAHGAMAALLKDAIKPNLVQTLERQPALVHGGPFANIAHGCNSVLATQTALKLADYVVTEAGFGADLGAEKFLHIKCRQAGLKPSAVVLVATIRALKMHGGVDKALLSQPNVEALRKGCHNLQRHIENLHKFGLPVVVAINHFVQDTEEEVQALKEETAKLGVQVKLAQGWAKGGAGMTELAEAVVQLCEQENQFQFLYPAEMSLSDKIETLAKEIYRASGIEWGAGVRSKLKRYEQEGYGQLPICMAKTQYSFGHDPKMGSTPSGFELPVRDVRLFAGAGFVVAYAGDIMTMPGLPKEPAALHIDIDEWGNIEGLF